MERKEFLSLMGFGTATIILSGCLEGCKKEGSIEAAPTNVDFTLDLSASSNSALNRNGGYIYSNGIIVARTLNGEYIAMSKACTHEGTAVVFESTNNRFYCNNHGATFSTSGTVTGGPARNSLTKYNTSLSGTSLRVYS